MKHLEFFFSQMFVNKTKGKHIKGCMYMYVYLTFAQNQINILTVLNIIIRTIQLCNITSNHNHSMNDCLFGPYTDLISVIWL